jgi:hypothetical protein
MIISQRQEGRLQPNGTKEYNNTQHISVSSDDFWKFFGPLLKQKIGNMQMNGEMHHLSEDHRRNSTK